MSVNKIFTPLGASNHTDKPREKEDFYATHPSAIDGLFSKLDLRGRVILEPCCGEGHLSKRMEELGCKVYSSDKVDRGFGLVREFADYHQLPNNCDCVVTNPPYKTALQCILHALDLLPNDGICAMFLKTTFLEGFERYTRLFRPYPMKYIFQFVKRIQCAKNGNFKAIKEAGGSAISYAWYVWEKGFKGSPTIDWINLI